MRISIIIPLYLGRGVIGRCLDSLIDCRDDSGCEIIVIDDCSPDGAGEFVSSAYPGIRMLVNEKNIGYAASVNRGLSTAGGEYILLLNQDTVVETGSVVTLVRILEEREDIAAVAPQLLNLDGSIQRSCRFLPEHWDVISYHLLLAYLIPESRIFSRWRMPGFTHDEELIVEQPSFSAILLRRSTIEAVGLLDERFRIFFNDVDYCRRMAEHGGKILFSPAAKVTHQRGQSTAQIPLRKILDAHRGFIRYFLKHYHGAAYLLPNLLMAVLLVFSGFVRMVWQLIRHPFISE
ncbi:MAG: glycosyltransferase family 2 protein [candidate division Zixibacteria bacterium]|nr:glycosyltransferase family 2 protein [candidate division Zixibacteria bacterium]MBU1469429.1 glycosyltransferase family 2 protein [candidate division Zixibacteria bacterium]MBU2624183.1 glycosyltransferase family 2 protein [candidate division Zixibacteria bacterium]